MSKTHFLYGSFDVGISTLKKILYHYCLHWAHDEGFERRFIINIYPSIISHKHTHWTDSTLLRPHGRKSKSFGKTFAILYQVNDLYLYSAIFILHISMLISNKFMWSYYRYLYFVRVEVYIIYMHTYRILNSIIIIHSGTIFLLMWHMNF